MVLKQCRVPWTFRRGCLRTISWSSVIDEGYRTTSVLYSTLPAQFFKRLSCPRTMNGHTNGAATAADRQPEELSFVHVVPRRASPDWAGSFRADVNTREGSSSALNPTNLRSDKGPLHRHTPRGGARCIESDCMLLWCSGR